MRGEAFFFRFLYRINVKCMSIFYVFFSKSWSTPMSITGHTLSSPFLILQWFATPHRVLRAQGVCVCVCVCVWASAREWACVSVSVWVCVSERACVRACVLRGSDNSHFKTRALVWKSCTICKKCKRTKKNNKTKQQQGRKKKKNNKKKTFKAHRLVSTFPTFALYWLFFDDLLFFSCDHFNIYYVFFFVYYR